MSTRMIFFKIFAYFFNIIKELLKLVSFGGILVRRADKIDR